jgi:hypothetical protein
MPVPTHILFEDSTGAPYGTIVLRSDFQPVMWLMDTLTMGVHNINADDSLAVDTTYDPKNAYHMMLTNDQQIDFYADIYPHDPYEVLDSLEWLFNDWLTHIRDLFDSIGIQTYNDLIAAGYINGPYQERWQIIATFISIGAAIVTYDMRDSALQKAYLAKMLPGGVFIPDPVKDMAKKIAEYLKDELACKYCAPPGVPTIRMLQCQGLKAVLWTGQVCHNSFMGWTSATRCLNLCKVTMKCFTNICMPRDVAVSSMKEVLWENNQEVTPEEVKDLVQQNIDNLSPILSL